MVGKQDSGLLKGHDKEEGSKFKGSQWHSISLLRILGQSCFIRHAWKIKNFLPLDITEYIQREQTSIELDCEERTNQGDDITREKIKNSSNSNLQGHFL